MIESAPIFSGFDIGVVLLTFSQILNQIALKMVYPFAGFIFPVLGLSYCEYVLFVAISNIGTVLLFIVQPLFEYLPTNYVLFLVQWIAFFATVSMVSSAVYLHGDFSRNLVTLTLSRMLFVFCVNAIWVHCNGAIRSLTIKNVVVHSRRNLLFRCSRQISSFLLLAVAHLWTLLDSKESLIAAHFGFAVER